MACFDTVPRHNICRSLLARVFFSDLSRFPIPKEPRNYCCTENYKRSYHAMQSLRVQLKGETTWKNPTLISKSPSKRASSLKKEGMCALAQRRFDLLAAVIRAPESKV